MVRLDYICFLNQYTGYATAARNMIEALIASQQYDIKITPIDKPKHSSHKFYPSSWESLIDKPDDLDRIQVFHCIPPMIRRFKRHPISIALVTYETESPPKSWYKELYNHNAVIVPSMFNYDNFAHNAAIKKKLFYVPHTLDFDLFSPRPEYHHNTWNFCWMGSWRERKGYKQTLQAFYELYSDDPIKQLFIKTDQTNSAQGYIRSRYGNCSNITITKSLITYEKMPRFMHQMDFILVPSLGEGFGLVGLQALAMQKPLITIDYSGCTEYATDETAFLLKTSNRVKLANLDRIPQFAHKSWFHVDVNELKKLMQIALDNLNLSLEKAKAGRKFVVDKFSHDNVLNLFDRAINHAVAGIA